MQPTDILKKSHRPALVLLKMIGVICAKLHKDKTVDTGHMVSTIDLIHTLIYGHRSNSKATSTKSAQPWLGSICKANAVFRMRPPLSGSKYFPRAKEELFDPEGSIGTDSRFILTEWMNQYTAWVRKHLSGA